MYDYAALKYWRRIHNDSSDPLKAFKFHFQRSKWPEASYEGDLKFIAIARDRLFDLYRPCLISWTVWGREGKAGKGKIS